MPNRKSRSRARRLPLKQTSAKKGKIVVTKDGPYLVSGGLPLCTEISIAGEEGEPERWEKGKAYPAGANYALCRCGRSGNQPFCDGTHTRVRFDGTEQAGSKSYAELAEIIEGPDLDLADAESLCASARFCEPKGGTWRLTLKSGSIGSPVFLSYATSLPDGQLQAC